MQLTTINLIIILVYLLAVNAATLIPLTRYREEVKQELYNILRYWQTHTDQQASPLSHPCPVS